MSAKVKSMLLMLTSLLFVFAPALPSAAQSAVPPQAPQHVVSPAQLRNALNAAMNSRQEHISKVESFLSTPRAKSAMKKTGLNYERVQQAIPMLSSSELASLSARADKAQKQFEGGSLTNQEITYIIIALATAVIILIIVKA